MPTKSQKGKQVEKEKGKLRKQNRYKEQISIQGEKLCAL